MRTTEGGEASAGGADDGEGPRARDAGDDAGPRGEATADGEGLAADAAGKAALSAGAPTLQAMEPVLALARRAGAAILEIYGRENGDIGLEWKDDRSPLTAADRAAHEVIVAGLEALAPEVPIVSEEGELPASAEELRAGAFWLVDPLDGTKEFLKRSGEFTVNIAFVQEGLPVAGVVYAPVLGRSWVAGSDGAELWEDGDDVREDAPEGEGARERPRGRGPGRDGARGAPLRVRPAAFDRLGIVASRDHVGAQVRALLERHPGAETLSMGSSLKFCLIAEGRADLYLRDGPTMEWDTAAAHAVVRAAGGDVFTLDGEPLRYAKPELRNPMFVAVGDLSLAWREIVGG